VSQTDLPKPQPLKVQAISAQLIQVPTVRTVTPGRIACFIWQYRIGCSDYADE
jgi:hypothetical protein